MLPPSHSPMIAELQAPLRRIEAHGAVEHITAGEVQQGVRVLGSRIVFDIDPMVDLILENTYSHVRHAGLFAGGGEEQVVSEQASSLQLQDQLKQQLLLVDVVFAADQNVDVAAEGPPAAVGPADLQSVVIHAVDQLAEAPPHLNEYAAYFVPRDLCAQLFVVPQSDLLVFAEQLTLPPQLFDRADTLRVEFFRFVRAHSPDFVEQLNYHSLLALLHAFQLLESARAEQFFDLFDDLAANSPQILEVAFRLDFFV